MFDKEVLDQLALSEVEYGMIVERLGREPNHLELGLFGSLWSEHCGYKHSKPLLKMFMSDNPRLLVNPGDENAGVVDIGEGLAIVFKVESHNHPSAIEPYEGAATGVGGIVRDIFAMGARPIALLNSLRFGSIDKPHNRYLFDGVVSGISGYGNCIGIPNVGGEVVFAESYTGNPLVNAMCIGILRQEDMTRATTGGEGNLLVLVGSGTGRDGIHGASGLASRTFDDDRELRPTVQVGNPFLEKVLIEACLEAAASGRLVGLQDLGAAGLTSAAVECAANGNSGIQLDIDKVPRRDTGMEPYEVMLSETQERMLLTVSSENFDFIRAIFDKWDVECSVIGKTTNTLRTEIFEDGVLKGDLPVDILTDPPLYVIDSIRPSYLDELQSFDWDTIDIPSEGPTETLLKILRSPNISSKHPVFRQYDHQVQTNTVIAPGNDASLIRIKGTTKGLAASTDGNGRLCYLNPYIGGIIAVAEACRNVSCTGANPIALTNCLNFGNPEKPEVYYQLENCVRGMAHASEAFESPVISGNVSLYNETRDQAIYPTPVIGAVGLTENVGKNCDIGFKNEGDVVFLLGAESFQEPVSTLSGSEYLEVIHGKVAGNPTIDLEMEIKVQKTCRSLIGANLLNSAHDCSDGGLAVALAESCISGGLGLKASLPDVERWDVALFGERQSRIIVSFSPEHLERFDLICSENNVPSIQIGMVEARSFTIEGLVDLDVSKISDTWHNALEVVDLSY